MQRNTAEMPPPLEIDCLKVLWTIGEANVKTVQQALGRDLAYTTVMTLLDRLARRGGAVRRKGGRGRSREKTPSGHRPCSCQASLYGARYL